MDKKQLAIEKHKEWKGKIEVISRAKVTTPEELFYCLYPGRCRTVPADRGG